MCKSEDRFCTPWKSSTCVHAIKQTSSEAEHRIRTWTWTILVWWMEQEGRLVVRLNQPRVWTRDRTKGKTAAVWFSTPGPPKEESRSTTCLTESLAKLKPSWQSKVGPDQVHRCSVCCLFMRTLLFTEHIPPPLLCPESPIILVSPAVVFAWHSEYLRKVTDLIWNKHPFPRG